MKNQIILMIMIAGSFMQPVAGDIPMSEQMANSIMKKYPEGYREGGKKWSYVIGTVLQGFQYIYQKTNNKIYYDYIKKTVDSEVKAGGSMATYKLTHYNLDQVREGSSVLFLYQKTGEEKYKKCAQLLRKQLKEQPRTSDGGFWHKKRYPYQMWQDGLYMAQPFYTEYAELFPDSNSTIFDDIVKQFTLMEDHARDPKTGLLYHAWDEKKQQGWADKTTGLSKCFWGRAMGWYAMALVDVIELLPANYSKRKVLIEILQRLLPALINYQDPKSGVWYQVVDQGSRTGNYLEASASCMFVYTILKAVRLGYADDSLRAAGIKGYKGILANFVTGSRNALSLNKICKSAGLGGGRDGSFKYYTKGEPIVSNDGKGLGPFLGASLEYEAIDATTAGRDNKFRFQQKPFIRQAGFILTVQSFFPGDAPIHAALSTLTGTKVVVPIRYELGSGLQKAVLDISNLPQAVYILNCRIGNFLESVKIVHGKSHFYRAPPP